MPRRRRGPRRPDRRRGSPRHGDRAQELEGQAIAPHGTLVAGGAPHGQIVIAGADGLLIQGAAGGPFSPLLAPGGSAAPMTLTTAYLGDVALASPPAAPSGGTA